MNHLEEADGITLFDKRQAKGIDLLVRFGLLIAVTLLIAGCSLSVRPTAKSISKELEENGSETLFPWLERRGFLERAFALEGHPNQAKSCVEKANARAMLFVGGVDVVRVCRDPTTGIVEVLHFHTHGIGRVMRTYNPKTGVVVCEDTDYAIERCEE